MMHFQPCVGLVERSLPWAVCITRRCAHVIWRWCWCSINASYWWSDSWWDCLYVTVPVEHFVTPGVWFVVARGIPKVVTPWRLRACKSTSISENDTLLMECCEMKTSCIKYAGIQTNAQLYRLISQSFVSIIFRHQIIWKNIFHCN